MSKNLDLFDEGERTGKGAKERQHPLDVPATEVLTLIGKVLLKHAREARDDEQLEPWYHSCPVGRRGLTSQEIAQHIPGVSAKIVTNRLLQCGAKTEGRVVVNREKEWWWTLENVKAALKEIVLSEIAREYGRTSVVVNEGEGA